MVSMLNVFPFCKLLQLNPKPSSTPNQDPSLLLFTSGVFPVVWLGLCFNFLPCHAACGILVPEQGLNPGREQSPNHRTAREFPGISFECILSPSSLSSSQPRIIIILRSVQRASNARSAGFVPRTFFLPPTHLTTARLLFTPIFSENLLTLSRV